MTKTMTLNLTDKEMQILELLANKKQLNKTALLRQALRLYQEIDRRIEAGEKIFYDDGKKQTCLHFAF